MEPAVSADGSIDLTTMDRPDETTLIAHRGFAGAYPENTLTAVRQVTDAAVAGAGSGSTADAIEIDVRQCGSGEPVVFHDVYLDRLTDAAGAMADRTIWETPLKDLRRLEVLRTGEPVPLLSEMLATIPPHVDVTVELKNPGTTPARSYCELPASQADGYERAWESFVTSVLDVLDGFDHDVLVTASFEGALRAMREVDPTVPLGYYFWDSIDTGLEITRRYDCEAVCPPRTMVPGTSFFNDAYGDLPAGGFEGRDIVGIAHEEGRTVDAWTIDTWQQAVELRAAGVDGLLCDYPGLLGVASSPSRSIDNQPADD